jgi:asparagine synthase (glutamine-hydrolysing)
MANTLLRDTDAMSMAHSLEVRVPFVDPVVADFVLGLPGAWKVNGDTGVVPKPLLADVLTDLLPGEFLTRKKMGFTLPFEKWMCGQLREEISGAFADDDRLTSAGVKPKISAEIWQRFLRSPKAVGWSRPWSLYVLAKWCEINQVSL